ncbi:MAG: EpsG family protein [Bacteroidales bacterium]|nr:EpsG family protein [Bacteroidales bacterium]
MNPLLVNFIICTVTAALLQVSPLSQRIKERIFIFISFVLLLLFHAFVDPSSMPDLPTYYDTFNELSQMSWMECIHLHNHYMELGYRLFMKTVSLFSSSFTVFLFVYSIILLLVYYHIVKKYSPLVILSVLMFLLTSYNQSLFVIRQHLAIAICLASIPFIINGKLIGFLISSMIAVSMHKTAIVFVPIYFLYRMDAKKMVWILSIVFLLMIGYFGAILRGVAHGLGYDTYVEMERFEGLNYVSFLMAISFLLLYVLSLRKHVFEPGINRLVLIALSISTMLSLFGIGFSIGRLGIYFSIFSVLSFPISLSYIHSRFLKFGIVVVVLAFAFYPVYMGSSSLFIEEYKLVWQSAQPY